MRDFKELSPVSVIALGEALRASKGSEHQRTYLLEIRTNLSSPTPKVYLGEISWAEHPVATSSMFVKIVSGRRGSDFRSCTEGSADCTE